MDTMLQTQWGWQIAVYLFLGGLGAGTLFVAACLQLKHPDELHKSERFAGWAGVFCLAIGTLLLLTDVRMPERALIMWQSFSNPGSWMAIGAWLLFCGIIVAGIFALMFTDPLVKALPWLAKGRKAFSIILLPLATCIAAYTGILLCVVVAHPLWNTPLLPVLFVISALDTGIALMSLFITLREKAPEHAALVTSTSARFEKTTKILVLLEVIVLVILLALVASGSEVGARSVNILLTGTLAPQFWLLFIVVGLAVPLACALAAGRAAKVPASEVGAPATATASDAPAATKAPEIGASTATAGSGKSASMNAPVAEAESEPAATAAKAPATETASAITKAPAAEAATATAKPTRRGASLTIIGAVCCLVGGCALRFLILFAGIPVWM